MREPFMQTPFTHAKFDYNLTPYRQYINHWTAAYISHWMAANGFEKEYENVKCLRL